MAYQGFASGGLEGTPKLYGCFLKMDICTLNLDLCLLPALYSDITSICSTFPPFSSVLGKDQQQAMIMQVGMVCYSGLNCEQIDLLARDFGGTYEQGWACE
ncbi:hypothetical protein SDJN02_11559, partial [Cucurbita argyrosperma subsp. argyrosperma]